MMPKELYLLVKTYLNQISYGGTIGKTNEPHLDIFEPEKPW